MKPWIILTLIALSLLLAAAVFLYLCERRANKELEKQAAFNAKCADEWYKHSESLMTVAEARTVRVKHIESGKVYTVYGHRVVQHYHPEPGIKEPLGPPHIELLVYMHWDGGGEFTFLDACWFEPLSEEEACAAGS